MPNSIDAVQEAELLAEKMILEAQNQKLQLLKSAQEATSADSFKALRTTEEKAAAILANAEREMEQQKQRAAADFEQQLQELEAVGKSRQSRAIAGVLAALTKQ